MRLDDSRASRASDACTPKAVFHCSFRPSIVAHRGALADSNVRSVIESHDIAGKRVCIVSASGQNVFFEELLDVLGDGLATAGFAVDRSVDRFPPWQEDAVYMFVPHEYVPLVQGAAQPTRAHLSRSVVLCTEQPGTSWFEETASIASMAAATVDINQLGARELLRRGIVAEVMQLGYVPQWDTWGGHDDEERPIDVTFMGGHTSRRGRALASCARFLVNRRAELNLVETHVPHKADSNHFLSGERRWATLRKSKLMLNIHRDELGYLEWLRVIGAIINGCVVVTEHSLGFGPLVPGEHFVSAGYNRLPFAIDALLKRPDRIAEIRQAAYSFVRDELSMANMLAPLVDAVVGVLRRPPESDLEIPVPTQALPRAVTPRQTEYERIFSHRSELDRVRYGVKELMHGQAQLRRRLDSLQRLSGDTDREDKLTNWGPRGRDVRVSVLLTVYNYADVVGLAIASVAGSDFRDFELVVVDDSSSDDSLAAIHGALAAYPEMTASVVARAANSGLAAARNCALRHARGDYVFILDADNQVYPHALGRLVAALDETPSASFAYGIIEMFGPEGPRDLMSWQTWDPARLRYGNYVDAMAMIRRAVLVEAGGYTTDRRLSGWEDFALWCTLANKGLEGLRVPEILSRYRTGVQSMIDTVDVDASSAWSALIEQNAFLAS